MRLPVQSITVPAGRRPLRDVAQLAESISSVGLLNPITVTTEHVLIAGYHRLEACRRLGWAAVPATVLDLSEVDRELAEIDENLCRNELTVLERGEQLARRKELYEARHPEARAEEQRKKGLNTSGEIISRLNRTPTFTSDAATRTGVSPRTVQQEVQIAERLDAGVKDAIRDTELAGSKTDLLKLARLDPAEQRAVVERIEAKGEAITSKSLRTEVHQSKNAIGAIPHVGTCTVADLSSLVEEGKRFGTIYADPPWLYGNQGTRGATSDHYGGMTVEEIAALPVGDLAEENAHLHLWTTNAFLFDCRAIMEAWGFTYKSCYVWVKPQMGMGNYWRVSHEFMLFGVRGRAPFGARNEMSWGNFPRGKHSAKPEQVRTLIERVSPGPYLELFGRRATPGWTVWGNQIERNLFHQPPIEAAA